MRLAVDKNLAKQLIDELLGCQRMLDATEVVARQIDDPSEQERIRKAIMTASGMLYTEVILGLAREYPDLDPYSKKAQSND